MSYGVKHRSFSSFQYNPYIFPVGLTPDNPIIGRSLGATFVKRRTY
jgi:hypothetical protein